MTNRFSSHSLFSRRFSIASSSNLLRFPDLSELSLSFPESSSDCNKKSLIYQKGTPYHEVAMEIGLTS